MCDLRGIELLCVVEGSFKASCEALGCEAGLGSKWRALGSCDRRPAQPLNEFRPTSFQPDLRPGMLASCF